MKLLQVFSRSLCESLTPPELENWNYRLRRKLYWAVTGKSMITRTQVGATIISDEGFFPGF